MNNTNANEKRVYFFLQKSKIKIKIDGQTENKLFISEHKNIQRQKVVLQKP